MSDQQKEELVKRLKEVTDMSQEALDELCEKFKYIISQIRECIDRMLADDPVDYKRQHHRLDLRRYKILDQVIDRKPKHKVRKIIH